MGREIRRVPPGWQHPKTEGRFQPMYDKPFAPTMREWFAAWERWESGERPDYFTPDDEYLSFWELEGLPPNPEHHRPDWKQEEMTWYQVYETISEGTPVTPAFETQAELVEYLVKNGDFWDQKRRAEGIPYLRCTPWPRAEADAFVYGDGWAPSMAIHDGKMMSGTEAMVILRRTK